MEKKIAFIGPISAGKTTLLHSLSHSDSPIRKTQVPEYFFNMVDIPGEFLEHRRFHTYLSVITQSYKVICFLIPCNLRQNPFSPQFASMFHNKKVIGIVTKTDLCADYTKATKMLQYAGVKTILSVSALTGEGIDLLKQELDLDDL